jgi:hypothetical protein
LSTDPPKLQRPRKRRLPPHAALALEFCTNPKVERAGLAAAGLYALMLSYCALGKTDGRVPKTWALKTGGEEIVQELVRVKLIRSTGDDYLIPDYLDFNYSKAEIAEVSEYTRELANKRWDNEREAA